MTMITASTDQIQALARAIAQCDPRWQLRTNRNKTHLVSLRWHGTHGVVSVHHALFTEAEFIAVLPRWIAAGGRGHFPIIDATLRRVSSGHHQQQSANVRADLPPFERLDRPLNLTATFQRLHTQWFAHTSMLEVGWGRGVAPGRTLTHIRFGAYMFGRQPRIVLHPRVNQWWVARIFAEFVLFHELCHHAQACRPVKGETPHSDRFRSWERRFPNVELALAWEKAYLPYLLNGTTPPDIETCSTPGTM